MLEGKYVAVQSAFENVVQEIKNLPEDLRSLRVMYLLESLDHEFGEEFLEEISWILEHRLKNGTW